MDAFIYACMRVCVCVCVCVHHKSSIFIITELSSFITGSKEKHMDVTGLKWNNLSIHLKILISFFLSMYIVLFYIVLYNNNTHQCLLDTDSRVQPPPNSIRTSSSYWNVTVQLDIDNTSDIDVQIQLDKDTDKVFDKSVNTDSVSRKALHANSNPWPRMDSKNAFVHKKMKSASLREPPGTYHRNRVDRGDSALPVLILFTSWPDSVSGYVRNNTCSNWASLKPVVHPVLFTNSPAVSRECRRYGWTILPLRHTAAGGLPVLKDMFSEVTNRFTSLFYGYSNGDIIYGENVLQTLLVIKKYFGVQETPLLVVGIRTNVANVTSLEASSFRNLQMASKSRGKLFIGASQDYFITNKAFPWSKIPRVVIGKIAYDNWLVLNSVYQNHTVVDATETVLAVHQTTEKGIFEGHSKPHSDYNRRLLSAHYRSINYGAGSTYCVRMVTKYSVNGEIFALKRDKVAKVCQNAYSGEIRIRTINSVFLFFYYLFEIVITFVLFQ